MFEDVKSLINNAAKLSERQAFIESVDSSVKQLIIDLNTKEQLGEFGIDADGNSLGEYAPFTVQVRSELGLQTDHVDFKVTGDYWKSWNVAVNGDEINITVDNLLFTELVQDLGFSAEHVGLTAENMDKLTQALLIRYNRYARKILGV